MYRGSEEKCSLTQADKRCNNFGYSLIIYIPKSRHVLTSPYWSLDQTVFSTRLVCIKEKTWFVRLLIWVTWGICVYHNFITFLNQLALMGLYTVLHRIVTWMFISSSNHSPTTKQDRHLLVGRFMYWWSTLYYKFNFITVRFTQFTKQDWP